MLKSTQRLFNCVLTLSRSVSGGIACSRASLNNVQSIPVISKLNSEFLVGLRSNNFPIITDQRPVIKINEIPINNVIIKSPRKSPFDEIVDLKIPKIIEEPNVQNNEVQAARLIVIRRRKMKKHKLRKLRKRMKFEWAKVRQRREMRKEKAFQAELIAQIKTAEKFSAFEYVEEKLRKANEIPIPRYWKGRRLPEFIIKEKLGIK